MLFIYVKYDISCFRIENMTRAETDGGHVGHLKPIECCSYDLSFAATQNSYGRINIAFIFVSCHRSMT